MIARSSDLAILEDQELASLLSHGRFVDVGGGPGHYAVRALDKLGPAWTAVIVDNYDDVGWFIRRNARYASRCEVRREDAFSVPLPKGEIYFLGSIIHNLADSDALAILKHCRHSAPKNAKIIVLERGYDPTRLRDSARDLDMRALFGGRERSNADLREIFKTASLSEVSMRHCDGYYRSFLLRTT